MMKYIFCLSILLSSFLTAQENDLPEFLRPLAIPDSPVAAFENGFSVTKDSTIGIFGGSNAAECQRNGWLELYLLSAAPNQKVAIRNFAFPADTVFEQPRPRNFFGRIDPDYGEKDGRPQIAIDIAIVWYGQVESLAGESQLPEFTEQYRKIINHLSNYTKQIILVTPVPFEDPLGLGLPTTERNLSLDKYADAIRKLAAEHNFPLIDLTNQLKTDSNYTIDGSLLSEAGYKRVAETARKSLGITTDLPRSPDYLRETICEKNRIWHNYWLPTNWAFLYGNRQSQPSSRDHIDKDKRWFPEELKEFHQKVEMMEIEIAEKIRAK